jgi:hypothetical protein
VIVEAWPHPVAMAGFGLARPSTGDGTSLPLRAAHSRHAMPPFPMGQRFWITADRARDGISLRPRG